MKKKQPFPPVTSPQSLKRRQFLLHAATLASTAGFMSLTPVAGAGAPATPAAQLAEREKVLAQLEADDESMFVVNRAETAVAYCLAQLCRAREILEIGTAHGYWTFWLALAAEARGGRVTTIEIVPERRARAWQHLQALGVARRVTSLEGDAHALVSALKKTYDFVFFNADKSGYLDYWRKLYPHKIKPGGLVLAYHYSARLDPIKDFVEAARANPQVATAVFHALPDDAFFAAVDLR